MTDKTPDQGRSEIPDDEPLLISRPAAARRVGRTTRTLSNWEKDGLLHPIRIRGRVFYRRDEFMDLVNG